MYIIKLKRCARGHCQVVRSVGAGTSENHKPAAGEARETGRGHEERPAERGETGNNGLQGI